MDIAAPIVFSFHPMPESIDTAKLMHEIRARVRGGTSGPSENGAGEGVDLSALSAMAEIDVARNISTHRKIFGPIYLRLRRWIHRENRMTLDPILQRQVELNKALIRTIAQQEQRIAELESRVSGLKED